MIGVCSLTNGAFYVILKIRKEGMEIKHRRVINNRLRIPQPEAVEINPRHRITFRVSEEDYQQLKKMAGSLSLSEYVKMIVYKHMKKI